MQSVGINIDLDPVTGRGYIDGYEVVDLGLPSGLLWATCNVGATRETDYGNYYMYGKCDRTYNSSDSIYTGMESPLAATADTATTVMGKYYRMPTEDEFQELIDNTIHSWTQINNVYGMKFWSKTNSNVYVFFPAAGQWRGDEVFGRGTRQGSVKVWSSSPSSDIVSPRYLQCALYSCSVSSSNRDYGQSVRGVMSVGG